MGRKNSVKWEVELFELFFFFNARQTEVPKVNVKELKINKALYLQTLSQDFHVINWNNIKKLIYRSTNLSIVWRKATSVVHLVMMKVTNITNAPSMNGSLSEEGGAFS